MRQIFFDIETTGFRYHEGQRTVEAAAIEYIDGKATGNLVHLYFNPERDVPMDAYKIHGLSTEFLSDKPLFRQAIPELQAFIEGAEEVIIHNGAGFDLPFMDAELRGNGLTPMSEWNVGKFTDSLKIARAIAGSKKNDLDSLCDKYKVDRSARTSHGAVVDCQLLAEMWFKMTADVNFNGPDTSQRQESIVRIENLPTLRVVTPKAEEMVQEAEYFSIWQPQGKKLKP